MVNLQGQEVHIDSNLKDKLDNIKKILNKNWDCLIIIDGKERVGKSTLGMTIGTYLYPSMGVGNIASDGKEAIEKLGSLPDKSVLMIDEGSLIFSSKDAMRMEQRRIIKILNVIGQKNMVLIIVLPSFFDLNKYIATERARFLLHCYSNKSLHRGRFSYFPTGKLIKLYYHGKKNFNSYNYPSALFLGRFVNYKPEWYESYLKTKEASLKSALHEDPKVAEIASRIKEYRMRIIKNLKKEWPEITQVKIGELLDVTNMTIHRNTKEMGVLN